MVFAHTAADIETAFRGGGSCDSARWRDPTAVPTQRRWRGALTVVSAPGSEAWGGALTVVSDVTDT